MVSYFANMNVIIWHHLPNELALMFYHHSRMMNSTRNIGTTSALDRGSTRPISHHYNSNSSRILEFLLVRVHYHEFSATATSGRQYDESRAQDERLLQDSLGMLVPGFVAGHPSYVSFGLRKHVGDPFQPYRSRVLPFLTWPPSVLTSAERVECVEAWLTRTASWVSVSSEQASPVHEASNV